MGLVMLRRVAGTSDHSDSLISQVVYSSLDAVRARAAAELVVMAAAAPVRVAQLPTEPLSRAMAIRVFFTEWISREAIREWLFRTEPVTVWKDRRWLPNDEYKLSHEGLCYYSAFRETWTPLEDVVLHTWWNRPDARRCVLNLARIDLVDATARLTRKVK
jgi:hypothetical protein